jgi:hypothetical protein
MVPEDVSCMNGRLAAVWRYELHLLAGMSALHVCIYVCKLVYVRISLVHPR